MNISQDPEENEKDSETSDKAVSVIVAGGLDPSGGAGLAADILALHAAGVIALPVATALTVQDSQTVYTSYPVDANIVEEQLATVMDDFRPQFMKLGLAGSQTAAAMIADFVGAYRINMVLDPIIASSSGTIMIDSLTKTALAELLVPKAFLITPNAPEAESLTGIRVNSRAEAREAAIKLAEMGATNVLITGGHITGDNRSSCVDYLYHKDEFFNIAAKREDLGEIRGTGCHLASSITAYLALGYELTDAISEARRYVATMIKEAEQGGQGAAQAL